MKYFGTDGFRGVAGTDLTVEHAYKIGCFIGWYYGARQGRKARIVVGKDTRRSSYMLESGMVSVLLPQAQTPICCTLFPCRAFRMKPPTAHSIAA